MSQMTVVTESHIELDERGCAWIRGAQTRVIDVVLDRIAWGLTADEIHREHPHLPLAKIHAALAYYYDHQATIDAEIDREAREFDAARAAAGESPLAREWRARQRRQQP